MNQKNYRKGGGFQKTYQAKIYIEKKPVNPSEESTNYQHPIKNSDSKGNDKGENEEKLQSIETKEQTRNLNPKKKENKEEISNKRYYEKIYYERKDLTKQVKNRENQQELFEFSKKKSNGRNENDGFVPQEEFKTNRGGYKGKKHQIKESLYEETKYYEGDNFQKKRQNNEEEYIGNQKKGTKNSNSFYDKREQKSYNQYNKKYDQGYEDQDYYQKEGNFKNKQNNQKNSSYYNYYDEKDTLGENKTQKIRKNFNKKKNFEKMNENFDDNKNIRDSGSNSHNWQKGNKNPSKKTNFKKYEDQYKKKRGGRNHDQRNILFPEFLEKTLVEEGLKNKTLLEGIFLSNDATRKLASIRCDTFEDKVFINDLESQNRALHGCTVAFKLITEKNSRKNERNDRQNWKNEKTKDMIITFVKKEEKNSTPRESKEKPEIEEKAKFSEASDWETVDEGEHEKVKEEEKIIENKEEKKIGEVVYILKNDYIDRDIIGKIENISEEKEKNSIHYKKKPNFVFVPNDKRLPKMFIKDMEQAVYDMIEKDSEILDHSYFIGRLLEWPNFSFYPHVHITSYLGAEGEIEIECKALLLENKVYVEDFEQKTIDHLSPYEQGEWQIPEEERKKRLDLTKKLICTIDPVTARDLDDALSIEEVSPGIFEIGVHIADVSYFVKENDPVDEEARKRTTSVYLPHRVIPMLPGILCEKLCSLNPGVERLAFSIFFKINENGVWLNEEIPRIGKSIIRSCGKLSYDVAQLIIEGKVTNLEEFPEICKVDKTIDGEKLIQGIIKMNELAQKRKTSRMKTGSLHFDKKKKRFQLNEKNIPISFSIEERKEANFLVEEYMLLANIIAGETMAKNCKEIALLRKHEAPQEKKIKALRTFLESLNIKAINTEDIFTIFDSIEKLKAANQITKELLSTLDQKLIRVMQLAKYFIVDDSEDYSWHHFALNFDVYTHFTSPIRRYPDVLVHRLLFNVIEFGANAREHTNKESMMQIMNKCNYCKQASRKVSDGCEKIFSCLCMKANNQVIFTKAIVLSFGKSGISISVPDFELVDFKMNLRDIKQIRDVKLEDNPKRKLILKISNKLKTTLKGRDKNKKFYYQEEEDIEDEDMFLRKLEFELFQEIDVKLGVKDKFPIDYHVSLTIRNQKNELECIS